MESDVRGRLWWWEEYRCGCVSPSVRTKRELVGYCPRHGDDRRHVHRDRPPKLKRATEGDESE